MSWYNVTALYSTSEGPRSTQIAVTDIFLTHLSCNPVPFATGYRWYRRWLGSGTPDGSYDEYWDSASPNLDIVAFEGAGAGGTPVTVQPPGSGALVYVDYDSVKIDSTFDNFNYLRAPLLLDWNHSRLAFGTDTGTEFGTIAGGADSSLTLTGSTIDLNGRLYVDRMSVNTTQLHTSNSMSVGGGVSIGVNYDDDDAPPNGLLVEGGVTIGTSVAQSNKLYVGGDVRSTSTVWCEGLQVGDAGTPPTEGAWIEGKTRIGTSLTTEWDDTASLTVYNKLSISSTSSVSAGLHLFQTDADPLYGEGILTYTKFSSGVTYPSYTHALRFHNHLESASNDDMPYFYWRFNDSGNTAGWTAMRLWGHDESSGSSGDNENVHLVMVGSKPSEGYRWTAAGSDTLYNNYVTTQGTTETFLSLPFGGYTDIPGFSGTRYAHVNDHAILLHTSTSSGSVYWYWPLHLPCGGVITAVRVRLETENITFSSPWGTGYLRKKAQGDAGAGSLVASANITTSGSHVWSMSLSEPIESGHAYYLQFYAGSSVSGGVDIKLHVAEIDITLDRHYPRWMV